MLSFGGSECIIYTEFKESLAERIFKEGRTDE